MYKAIIFDLDDTLYDYETVNKIAVENLCNFVCSKYEITERQFEDAFTWAKKQTKTLLGDTGSSHNRMLYSQKILEYLGKNPIEGALELYNCYWDSMLSNMKLRDGSINLLKRLKDDRIKIAICTDLTAHIQHRKLQKLNLASYIDVLVTSEEAGAEKPSEKIFCLVFEKLKKLLPELQKSDCLFVGDSQRKDVDGPRAFGLKSILFDNIKKLEKYIYG